MTSADTGTPLLGPEVIRPEGSRAQTIGRGTSAAFPLLHPGVSRNHAQVAVIDNQILITDLGSRFGTKVNGKRIDAQSVGEGDRIEFGPVTYLVRGFRLELL